MFGRLFLSLLLGLFFFLDLFMERFFSGLVDFFLDFVGLEVLFLTASLIILQLNLLKIYIDSKMK